MIGKNIHELRRNRGLSLSELSERSGISKSYLSNIERDVHKNPSIQILEKISDVLNVDLINLVVPGYSSGNFLPDKELYEFVTELKKTGIEKENIQEYKQLIDFIKWQNEKVHAKK
ncbi:helix-turn-helix transcriptional regulator [Bacillus sp. ISL-37]|uniref:helix-turn-helix domain-containing protein n=1 Tax=Bacillus sp. ISL-37 TaxID=2819123 RepID=UPI001BEBF797|nr:helix-turn-helix transcriptional regulator [Bacillus sp. ISL-37]MBT2686208.1 helix-turn-helix transcriptional regulator [Bacillus sp. ISL-37]